MLAHDMADLRDPPTPFDRPAYLARITRRDGPAIEEAMAGATLLGDGARLDGAVIEAAYAFDRPPLLKRLRDDRVPRVIDLQTLRFTGPRYLETQALSRLPYAPASPIVADDFSEKDAEELAQRGLAYAQDRGTECYLAPTVPLFDQDVGQWIALGNRLLCAAVAHNGAGEIERKPLIAQIAPGPRAMTRPETLIDRLLDYPIDAVYVQALRLNPVTDSLEKLARFVQFVAAVRDAGFPVIVGRVGAFGLVLQALGIPVFDSGLGQAEAHDLATLNRRITDAERSRRADGSSGGPQNRVYLESLKSTLPAPVVRRILASDAVRSRFACNLGCCRFGALDELPARARNHYLYVRRAEVDAMKRLSVAAMRLHEIETQLRAARDLATIVRRATKPTDGLPDFGHLDRWLGLIAREQQVALAA
jgi:hypothetical protein